MGICRTMSAVATAAATARERTRIRATSLRLRCPYACDVMPPVPILRNEKSQYITLNTIPPTAMAPIYAAEPRWPTMATSTSPSSGTVMLLTIAGRAIFSMRLFMSFIYSAFKDEGA